MTGLIVIATILAVNGCISFPSIHLRPVETVTYEFDKDKQQWTKIRCIASTQMGDDTHSVETVCQKQIIPLPPTGVEKRVAE